jgi:hypothetical protein
MTRTTRPTTPEEREAAYLDHQGDPAWEWDRRLLDDLKDAHELLERATAQLTTAAGALLLVPEGTRLSRDAADLSNDIDDLLAAPQRSAGEPE